MLKTLISLKNFFLKIIDIIDDTDLCPYCGYYCTKKSVYCNEPFKEMEGGCSYLKQEAKKESVKRVIA